MNCTSCRTLILGATCYGLSRLRKEGEGCLLLERTTQLGAEFVDSFWEAGPAAGPVTSPFGRRFVQELKANGLLGPDGEVYPAPALFLLCQLLLPVSGQMVFNAQVTGIEPSGGGYLVTYVCGRGVRTVRAEQIVDTTSAGVLHSGLSKVAAEKSLCAVIHGENTLTEGRVFQNRAAGTTLFGLPAALDETYVSVQARMHRLWQGQQKGCRLTYLSNTFAYAMPQIRLEVGPGWQWVPSCGFGHMLDAIEGGQRG